MKSLRNIVGGLVVCLSLAGCGEPNESKKKPVLERNIIVLSNGMEVPRAKVSEIRKFYDEKQEKQVTAYYFLEGIKTDVDYMMMFNDPPAIYDLGDGKPFRLLMDNPIPRRYKSFIDEHDIEEFTGRK